jgi:hypothetical protein
MVTVLIYIPKPNIEIIFHGFAMLWNCGIFAYAINDRKFIKIYLKTKKNIKNSWIDLD